MTRRNYDKILVAAQVREVVPVIVSKRNRKVVQKYDAALYQARHLVENEFGKLKE